MARPPKKERSDKAEHAPALEPTASAEGRRAALYLVMAQIPEGKVISYGELAALSGLGRAARWVGRTLSQLPQDTRLPWHRVLAAGGRLSLAAGTPSGEEQRARLRAEGLTIRNDRVDMRRHGWRPMEANG
ncbi:MGMT family protein [Pseudomonas sp. PDM15]|jgi:methylated-DNA-protein-cysteine methyltransferase-like protein|uniref:MGMT family protein n=1 Tax=Pseudomonas sp. PDM15 TaxID=2769303 RepID=UPI001784ECB5|nr:MGMT family protein [Pseudomonas sp. PDM15]MBD9427608.1 MGMT family protein [Pseudomonas sp. PDM15]